MPFTVDQELVTSVINNGRQVASASASASRPQEVNLGRLTKSIKEWTGTSEILQWSVLSTAGAGSHYQPTTMLPEQ